MARFPNELLCLIVTCVYDSDSAQERAILHSLLFASRMLYRTTLPVLYRNLRSISGTEQIQGLIRTLVNNTDLASYVHQAEIEFNLLTDYGELDPPDLPNCVALKLQTVEVQAPDRALAQVLGFKLPRWVSACKNLRVLVLSSALILFIFQERNFNSSVTELQIAGLSRAEAGSTIMSLDQDDTSKIHISSEPVSTKNDVTSGMHFAVSSTFRAVEDSSSAGLEHRERFVDMVRTYMPNLRIFTPATHERGLLGDLHDVTALSVIIAYEAGLEKTAELSLLALGNAIELNMPRLQRICITVERDEQKVRIRDRGFRKTLEWLGVDVSSSVVKTEEQDEKSSETFRYDPFLTPAEAEEHEFLPVKEV